MSERERKIQAIRIAIEACVISPEDATSKFASLFSGSTEEATQTVASIVKRMNRTEDE